MQRYLVTTVASFLVVYSLTVGLHEYGGLSEQASFYIGLAVVFVQNFVAMRYYVYGRSDRPLIPQFLVYSGSALMFRGIESLTFSILTWQHVLDYRIVTILVLGCSSILKFVYYHVVFKSRAPARQPANSEKPGHNESAAVIRATGGLLSPWLRDVRLRVVAGSIEPGSSVLDLACGAASLADHLPGTCHYYGVDCLPFPSQPPSKGAAKTLLSADLASPESPGQIQGWLGQRVDVITMIACVECLKEPARLVHAYSSLLKPGGKILCTTPHPVGRMVHAGLARLHLCTPAETGEHRTSLGYDELRRMAESAGGTLSGYRRFLFGLNQFFVLSFPADRPDRLDAVRSVPAV